MMQQHQTTQQPTPSSSSLTTPPPTLRGAAHSTADAAAAHSGGAGGGSGHRSSIKASSSSADARGSKRKQALRELGKQHRHAILQQLRRNTMSPMELKGKLHANTMAAMRAQLLQPEPDGDVLTPADVDALLAEMEAAVMAEIQAELAAWEAANAADAAAVGHMAEAHEAFVQRAGPGAVLCPVCKAGHLALRHGLLVCPAEGWRVNVAAEGVSMEGVSARLAAAYEEHAAAGCAGQLQFAVEDLFGCGDSLTSSCATCNSLAVVV